MTKRPSYPGPGSRIPGPGSPRDIPAANSIRASIHCADCIEELNGAHSRGIEITPREYANIEIGWTPIGIQVWCFRHNHNIIHIDFQKTKHPANTTREDS